jgi:lipoprotein-anchoring transpeptidase ErfK/SrfK
MPKLMYATLVFLLVVFGRIALAEPALAQSAVHVVRPGETLGDIAQQYGISLEALRAANHLGDVDFVEAGRTLQLSQGDSSSAQASEPAAQAGMPVEEQTETAPVPAFAGEQEHVVQPGEDLGAIATMYRTTPEAIAVANQLANPNLIAPGQSLQIVAPGESSTTAQPVATVVDLGAVPQHPEPPTNDKWIEVDVARQQVIAYVGAEPIRAFLVSTGLPRTPTVTGTFRIWGKTPLQDMSGGSRVRGDYYFAPDVPWVQYFYADYSFHGTYWHSNFGQPMSHGCVNMRTEDAKWMFDWASPTMVAEEGWLFSSASNPGTLVVVHE